MSPRAREPGEGAPQSRTRVGYPYARGSPGTDSAVWVGPPKYQARTRSAKAFDAASGSRPASVDHVTCSMRCSPKATAGSAFALESPKSATTPRFAR